MRSFFSLILFQIIVPAHPRRLDNHHKTLKSSMNDQVTTSRFSTLYEGRDWNEVTHLPPGWKILDFGTPGDQMRFQTSLGHSKVPPKEQLDILDCAQGSDDNIHCGRSPSNTNPNNGGGLIKKTEDVSTWKPENDRSPGGILTKDGEGNSVDGNPTSSGTKPQNPKPNDNEKNSPSSKNSLRTSGQSSPTGGTKEDKNKDSTDTKLGTENKFKTSKLTNENKNKDSTDAKLGNENKIKEKDYVIGGGFVVTLKVFNTCGYIVPDSL